MGRAALTIRKKLLFAAITVIVFFAAAEGLLRLFLFRYTPPSRSLIVWSPMLDKSLVDPRHTFQFHPECFWEPRPGAEYFDLNVRFGYINESGFRGPDYPVERDEGVVRVACFGDSSTFGMLVPETETYPRRLESLLGDALGRRVEVINAGVIGYSVFQGLARYRCRVRPYGPDVVTLAFGAINDGLPAGTVADCKLIERTRRMSSLRSVADSPLARLRLVQLFFRLAPGAKSRTESRQRLVAEFERHHTEFDRGEPCVPRVSVAEFGRLLEEFVLTARGDGVAVVLIVPPRQPDWESSHPNMLEYTDMIERTASELNVPLLNIRERFRAENEAGLLLDNVHPSPSGHRVIAELLVETIASAIDGSSERGHGGSLSAREPNTARTEN